MASKSTFSRSMCQTPRRVKKPSIATVNIVTRQTKTSLSEMVLNLLKRHDRQREQHEEPDGCGQVDNVTHAPTSVASAKGVSLSARIRASSGKGLRNQRAGRNSASRLAETGAAEITMTRRDSRCSGLRRRSTSQPLSSGRLISRTT